MIGRAKIPKGCVWMEIINSPFNKLAKERPRPQPGQKLIPENLNRQRELYSPSSGFKAAKRMIAVIQISNSVYFMKYLIK